MNVNKQTKLDKKVAKYSRLNHYYGGRDAEGEGE